MGDDTRQLALTPCCDRLCVWGGGVQASVPYMEMLEAWVYHGRLDDPYQEFMVREEQSLQKENVEEDFNAAYWDARCGISRITHTQTHRQTSDRRTSKAKKRFLARWSSVLRVGWPPLLLWVVVQVHDPVSARVQRAGGVQP